MAISDTSFFSAYQQTMGLTYAKGFDEINNLASTLPTYVTARQLMLASLSSTDVVNAIVVINSHLQTENTYSTACSGIVKNVLQNLNNFFNITYGVFTRDYFNSLSTNKIVAWKNSFVEAWYQANNQELVQQIGFATWNGVNFQIYPPFYSLTRGQNTAQVFSTS